MSKKIIASGIDVMDVVRKKYPLAKAVPVCAFGIIYSIYKDDTYNEQIAETRYYPREAEGFHCYNHELIYLGGQ
jgi:hypothetical protein